MAINMAEFNAVKRQINDELLALGFTEAAGTATRLAFKELYDDSGLKLSEEESLKATDRMYSYARELVLTPGRFDANRESDDVCCRDIECFDRISPWKYGMEWLEGATTTVESDLCGTWTAKEYDSDGDLSHMGIGKSPQEALDSMRMLDDYLQQNRR